MKKTIMLSCVIFSLMFVLSFASDSYAQDSKGEENDTFQQTDLKKQCLSATIVAINLEIERYQRWIEFRKKQEDQKDLVALQESLAALEVDLERHRTMDAKDYVLPEKIDTVAWMGDRPGKDSVLYVEGMTKSGPWYHVAGVGGDDYSLLQRTDKQQINLYCVYPRSYWGMSSAYVYIGKMETKQLAQGKKMLGEVFVYKYSGPLYDAVKCENYQVYLLKDIKPGTKGELILDSKESSFEITLSAEQLKGYSYMEFVSAASTKTIKLTEITDNRIKIILEPEVFLKKPAIYLYPQEETKISISHKFKGRILNTYPAYLEDWTVIAQPNGKLLNVKDKRYYNYLFWDGAYSFSKEHYEYKSGFYVTKEDYILFLQQKLGMIGLNDNEINDFIVFWLPVMSKHQKCFVYFRINDNIDGSSVLETKPVPETTIRVFMEFSGVNDRNSTLTLPEQRLPTFARKGFTLVEWGGAEIGNSKIE